jgi:uncharacterized protein YcaQ
VRAVPVDAPVTLSAAQARRLALAAQGLHRGRPSGPIGRRHVRRVLDRIGLLQLDSVNVLVRSQELPLFARLGPHPRHLLDELVQRRELFEYWGHEASLLPVELHPLLRWRMRRAEEGQAWRSLVELRRNRPEYVDHILAIVRERGPVTARSLADGTGRNGPWWGWQDHKLALEALFWTGVLTSHGRTATFERRYDLSERVLPAAVLAAPTPAERDAHKALLHRAVRHLGVATAAEAADYFRLSTPTARPLLDELVGDGSLRAATVTGWDAPGYLDPAAVVPRRVDARALLSPFDSLVWHRGRTERLFGFRYRLELYTPAHRRVHGYYVLPFLLDDALVARVDLKADRRSGTLRVLGAFAEPGQATRRTAAELTEELQLLAGWLGLGELVVGPDARGDLVAELAAISRPRAGRPTPPTSG